jgi:hypothetical protein
VACNSAGMAPVTATLCDISGRVLITRPITASLNQIDVSNLAAGIYHLVFTDDKGNRAVKRVVIE